MNASTLAFSCFAPMITPRSPPQSVSLSYTAQESSEKNHGRLTHNPPCFSFPSARICSPCGYTFEKKIDYFLFCKEHSTQDTLFLVLSMAPYEDVLRRMSPESRADRIYVGSELVFLLFPLEGFKGQQLYSSHSSSSMHVIPLQVFHSLTVHVFRSRQKEHLYSAANIPLNQIKHVSALKHLNLTLPAQFLNILLPLSSHPKAGERTVNHPPTALKHCRQPLGFTHACRDRLGGQASVDLLEGGTNRGGSCPSPGPEQRRKIEAAGIVHVFFCVCLSTFSRLGISPRQAQGWNL